MVDEPVTMIRPGKMNTDSSALMTTGMAGTAAATGTADRMKPDTGTTVSGIAAAGVTITETRPPDAPGLCALVAQAIS